MNLMTLAQAGISEPDTTGDMGKAIRRIREFRPEVALIGYGGWPRDAVILGDTGGSNDIDLTMSVADYLSLKPDSGDHEALDTRWAFTPHMNTEMYRLHKVNDGLNLRTLSRQGVMLLSPQVQAMWRIRFPVSVTLNTDPVSVAEQLADTDLGFSAIVYDGEQHWVTEAFARDLRDKTMTLIRCEDLRNFQRSMERVKRFSANRYAGWKPVIPPEFAHFVEEAEALAREDATRNA